jgi:uncharacterized protein YuzE
MITYKYDKKAGCGYISLGNHDGPVGTMEVSGRDRGAVIRYRKPTYEEEFKGLILLDFNKEHQLVGIELVGNDLIPEKAKDSTLSAKSGKKLHDCIAEANALHAMLYSQGLGSVIHLNHNDIVYSCDGGDVDAIIAHAKMKAAKRNET